MKAVGRSHLECVEALLCSPKSRVADWLNVADNVRHSPQAADRHFAASHPMAFPCQPQRTTHDPHMTFDNVCQSRRRLRKQRFRWRASAAREWK